MGSIVYFSKFLYNQTKKASGFLDSLFKKLFHISSVSQGDKDLIDLELMSAEALYLVNIFTNIQQQSAWRVFLDDLKYFGLNVYRLFLDKIIYQFASQNLRKQIQVKANLIKAQYQFYCLLYVLERHQLVCKDADLYKLIKDILMDPTSKSTDKLKLVNEVIADFILQNYEILQTYHIKELYRNYVDWLKSYQGSDNYLSFIQKEKSSEDRESYRLSHQRKGLIIKKKSYSGVKYLKKKIKSFSYFIVLLTSVAFGVIPAVLAAGAWGNILSSLLIIGGPSIVINIILYNTSVKSFIRELFNGSLLKNRNNKINWVCLPLFILSLCVGVAYGAMVFVTSLIAFKVVLTSLFSFILSGSVLIWLSAMTAALSALALAFSTIVSTTALYFSSLVDVVRQGLLSSLEQFLNTNFIKVFNSDIGLFKKSLIIASRIFLYSVLLISAAYLTFVETALLYSMSIVLIPNSLLSLGIVLSTVPANLLFTFKIYNFVCNTLYQIPNFVRELKNNFQIIWSNPVLLYESIKTAVKGLSIILLIFDYAKGSARGLVDEVAGMNFFGVNLHMDSRLVSGITQVAEAADCAGACLEGATETCESTITRIYSSQSSLRANATESIGEDLADKVCSQQSIEDSVKKGESRQQKPILFTFISKLQTDSQSKEGLEASQEPKVKLGYRH